MTNGNLSRDTLDILLVEDNADHVFLIKKTLGKDRFHITVISDGKEALDYLIRPGKGPDVVVMDYRLPTLDGLRILEETKKAGKNPAFIFLAADSDIETAVEAMRAGALNFIPKDGEFYYRLPEIIEKVYILYSERMKKHRIEKALKESEERLTQADRFLGTIIDNTHLLIAYMDSRFNFIRVNRAYAEADGRVPSFFPGKHHFDLYPNPENEIIFQRVLETGEPYMTYARAFEYPENPERGVTYWDWSLIPVKTPEGPVTNLVLTLADVTERVRAQEEIRRQNEFLNNMIESLTHPFYVVNAGDFTIELANSAAAGKPLASGMTCYSLSNRGEGPCNDPDHICPVSEIKKTKKPAVVEHIHYSEKGEKKVTEVHGYPLFDKEGNVERIIEYALDITLRKEVEEKIKASLKEKEILLKEIHHRVKNNLQVIISLLNLQADKIDQPGAIEAFRESRNRIYSMALVHEKLYQSADFTNIDFRGYLRTMTQKLFSSYEITGRVSLDLDIGEVFLGVDKAIPCGIVVNELVTNALKYAFPGEGQGHIRIALRTAGNGSYRLTVQDDGTGMPAGIDLETIDSLGLQLVKLLTEQIGGAVSFDSGNGTTFTVTFPG